MIVGQRHSRPIFASFFDSEIWPEHLPDYLSKAVPKDNFFFEVLCLFGLTLSKLTFFHTFLDHLFQGFSGNQDSLHVHFQICVGNLVWISNSNLHRFLVPLTHLNSPSSPLLIHPPMQRRVCTVYAPTSHLGGDRSMGTSSFSFFFFFFTVNNKCHKRERREKQHTK